MQRHQASSLHCRFLDFARWMPHNRNWTGSFVPI
jgi:hypothetical protein